MIISVYLIRFFANVVFFIVFDTSCGMFAKFLFFIHRDND